MRPTVQGRTISAIVAASESDSLSPVHANMVLGTHGNGERLSSLRTGRVYLRVARGALAGKALSIEQLMSGLRRAGALRPQSSRRAAHHATKPGLWRQISMSYPRRSVRSKNEHFVATPSKRCHGVITRCYAVNRATTRPCAARRLASKFSHPASFLYRVAIKGPWANVAYEKED